MPLTPKRVVVCAILFIGLTIHPVIAAAPRAFMFFGGSLPRPVFLADWQENLKIMGSAYAVTPEELANRAFLNVVMFTNPQWEAITAGGRRPVSQIRAEEVTPNARFCPAKGDSPALLVTRTTGWTLTKEGTEILARAGIAVADKSR